MADEPRAGVPAGGPAEHEASSSLASRIGRQSTLLVAICALILGAAFVAVLQHEREAGYEALEQQHLQARAAMLARRLVAINGQVEGAARSSVMATALVDSVGKDAYLIPYLQGLHRIEGVPVSLAFTDFEGYEVARNDERGLLAEDFGWLQRALQARREPPPQIVGEGLAARMLVACRCTTRARRTPRAPCCIRSGCRTW